MGRECSLVLRAVCLYNGIRSSCSTMASGTRHFNECSNFNIVSAAMKCLAHQRRLTCFAGQQSMPLDQIYPELRALVAWTATNLVGGRNRLTGNTTRVFQSSTDPCRRLLAGGVWAGRPTLMLWRDARVSLFEFTDGDIIETTIELTTRQIRSR